jgi:hypothetical protein
MSKTTESFERRNVSPSDAPEQFNVMQKLERIQQLAKRIDNAAAMLWEWTESDDLDGALNMELAGLARAVSYLGTVNEHLDGDGLAEVTS